VVSLLAEAAAATVDRGRVRVCLKHNRAAVMLSIKDQGEGLTAEQRGAILGDVSRPACQGAPMTLPECRDAVAGMGGSLFVNSTPGRGTTWYLTIPPPKRRAF
jgi:signal transduction histidine kinase